MFKKVIFLLALCLTLCFASVAFAASDAISCPNCGGFVDSTTDTEDDKADKACVNEIPGCRDAAAVRIVYDVLHCGGCGHEERDAANVYLVRTECPSIGAPAAFTAGTLPKTPEQNTDSGAIMNRSLSRLQAQIDALRAKYMGE